MNDLVKIVRYSWQLKRYYLLITILVVIGALLSQATPFFLKFIVDDLVRHGSSDTTLWWLLSGILGVNIIIAVLSNIQGYLGDNLGAKLNSLLSERYFAHVLKLPLSYYDNEVAGKITSRLERSIITISSLMSTFSNNFTGMILTSLITLGILAYYAWPVAIMLALLFPFYLWVTALSSKSWQVRQETINHDTDTNNGRFVESVAQIRVVKSFVQEVTELTRFSGLRRSVERETALQSRRWHWYDVARRIGLAVIFFGIYAYIVIETSRGKYTVGDLTLLLQLVIQAQIPLFGSSFIVDSLQRAQAGSKDFFGVMETRATITDRLDAKPLKVSRGAISYRNVSFAYDGGGTVIDAISFDVAPGSKIALVGESGEGKTTLTNLLLRFYEPTSGVITIDDNDIAGVTQASLRSQIGVVFQEPALFSGTVRDNVRYGRPEAHDRDVIAAIAAANASDFVERLPQGIDTEIGERGVKLSGGQRQRLAIARAILKNPPILVLDEATSSLDSRSEHEVQKALTTLMAGRTTIIIAHRLSTIAGVDQIVSLREGTIVERGTPAELAVAGGIYAELLDLQQSGTAGKAKLKRYDVSR